jgi:hypothetical protein
VRRVPGTHRLDLDAAGADGHGAQAQAVGDQRPSELEHLVAHKRRWMQDVPDLLLLVRPGPERHTNHCGDVAFDDVEVGLPALGDRVVSEQLEQRAVGGVVDRDGEPEDAFGGGQRGVGVVDDHDPEADRGGGRRPRRTGTGR